MTAAERAQRRLQDLASGLEPALRRAFLDMAAGLTPESLEELVRLLDAGQLDQAVAYLTGSPQAVAAIAVVRSRYAAGLIRIVGAVARDLAYGEGGRKLIVAAPVASPELVAAVRRWEDGAFARVLADVREGLRETIARELARGIGPRQVALALKRDIGTAGLTAYDARIIASFRAALEEGRATDALRRTLRDRRFDQLLRREATLTPAKIDRMVAAYRRKLIAFRAETFARTSAIQAANEASEIGWRTAVTQGAVATEEIRRYWVVAADERLCETCSPVPARYPNGVGLDDQFLTDVGAVRTPPLHPNCRCTVWIRRERPGVQRAPQPGTTRLVLPRTA